MSVNWNWNDKKGKIVWKEIGGDKRIEWQFYHANCWGCFLKEFQENGKRKAKVLVVEWERRKENG